MDTAPVLVEIDGEGTGWLTLNRPAVHNAFDEHVIARLTEGLRALAGNPTVRAVVLAARGSSFSAGADLAWMERMAAASFEENVRDAMGLAGLLATLERLAKPTIALVQGPAYGGGVGLVAACDMAIAVETATFALTEVRLGLIPAVISPYVVAAIGPRQARRYFLSGEAMAAADAHRIGLIPWVVPPAELASAGQETLRRLAGNGPEAMADAKDLVRTVAGRAVDDGLMELTAERIARARASDEAKARMAAFLARSKDKDRAC